MKNFILCSFATASLFVFSLQASDKNENPYWVKLKAKDRFERTVISEMGVSIEAIYPDYVVGLASPETYQEIKDSDKLLLSFEYKFSPLDFPLKDEKFHNYSEMTQALQKLETDHPDYIALSSAGQSIEGRDIWVLKITEKVNQQSQKPAVILMGGHHAREHVSMEIPLLFVQQLMAQVKAGEKRILDLLATRELHVIPMVNPDGSEYDIEGGYYKMWRTNRRVHSNGKVGVDLNRNYGYMWGQGGASATPGAETYRGEYAFSEPETQAIKNYVESTKNISILLSLHTYSELILYPWGHTYSPIANQNDFLVHETMAKKMATWNGYTPQQASDLYIASGGTDDWSYGEHKIISFTFELDPKQGWFSGGFYPGQSVLPTVLKKNTEPFLYLLEYADNPYRVIAPKSAGYGLRTALITN